MNYILCYVTVYIYITDEDVHMKMKYNKNNTLKQNRMYRLGKGTVIALALFAVLLIVGVALICINDFNLEITMNGDSQMVIEYGTEYTEAGAEAAFYGTLFIRKPISLDITVTGIVDDSRVGSYTVTYNTEYTLDYFFGSKKYTSAAVRTIDVVDSTAPIIELTYVEGAYTLPGHPYEEEGYTATDNYDGDITADVTVKEEGGKVYYKVADSSGNEGTAVREIFYDDPIPPEIKLLGDGDIIISEGGSFKDPGYAAFDNIDGDLTSAVNLSGTVDTSKAGKYTLTYTVTDGYENTAGATRVVTVREPVQMPETKEGEEHLVLHTEPVNPNGKVIYLTFDDGPGAHTARLLDVLKKYDVKATFFVVNTKYLDILPRMHQEGHTVAMHTATHNYDLIYSSDEEYFKDLSMIENAIRERIGEVKKILRFPGGGSNGISRKLSEGIMTRLVARVKELGYRYFDWNVDSNDAGGTRTAEGIYNNVISAVPHYQYSVVLQHDIHGYSVDAVERIIIWGLENGYTFKALTENSPVCEHKVSN